MTPGHLLRAILGSALAVVAGDGPLPTLAAATANFALSDVSLVKHGS
jgi:hypothetical protein